MFLWEALGITEKGILTCVGAGGKSSLLMSLGKELQGKRTPFLLTSTTKMFFQQVWDFAPVITRDEERGRISVGRFIQKYGYAAWFSRWYGTKVEGLPSSWIDGLFLSGYVPLILVEGDGARQKLLKAPEIHEPVVPSQSTQVVGILNLRALGRLLSPELVHRPQRVMELLGKDMGDKIEVRDMALLAGHSQGIFQGSGGTRFLVLTGANGISPDIGREILRQAQSLGQIPIKACIMTTGFGQEMKPISVID